ncbi:MAG TPA: sigma-70 family RNA polymerase sigma factor [Cryomorphaceae bacterium]|nr:sigma-70 family RNA polymerase sigma factor [Cryomorphaceae bacterium]
MVETGMHTDLEIVRRIADGEKALYELIVRRYNPYLYKVGRSYGYNHEDAQDLMQDTFVDAYRSLGGFEGKSAFKSWLIRIMLNNCYRKRNKQSHKNEVMRDINDGAKPLFSHTEDTARVVGNNELGRIIEMALLGIPTDYRMVFSLREITGLNVAETAEALHITESNVKVRLNRAKTMLRKEIEKSYSSAELFEFNLIYCDAMVDRVMREIDAIR